MSARYSAFVDGLERFLGSPTGAVLTAVLILLDLLWGIYTRWAATWNQANGAATGIVSIVLLVFLLHSQVRGNEALHLKVDALAHAAENVSDDVVGAERLPRVEIQRLHGEAVEQVETATKSVVEEALDG